MIAWDSLMLLHVRHSVDETLDRFTWQAQTMGEGVVPA